MQRTLLSFAKEWAKLKAKVVLPTPPFWFIRAIAFPEFSTAVFPLKKENINPTP